MYQQCPVHTVIRRALAAVKVRWAQLFSVPLDGSAVCAGWEKDIQPQESSVHAIAVEKGSDKKTAHRADAFWIRLMKIGAATGCHQLNERSFSAFGYQFPVCARCTGLAAGQLFGIIASFFLLNKNILFLDVPAVLSLLFLGIDGLGQHFHKWESTNIRRLITGLLCGFFVIVLIVRVIFS